jgi:hypothetical protein
MAELAFPPPPLTVGQEYVGPNGVTYEWDGEAWVATAGTVAQLWVDNAASGLMSPANAPRSLSLYPASAIHFGDPTEQCPCINSDADGLTLFVPATVTVKIGSAVAATFDPNGLTLLIGRLLATYGIQIGPAQPGAEPGTISYHPDGHFRGVAPGGWVQLDGASGPAAGDLSGQYPAPSLRPGLIPTSLPPSGPVPPGGALVGAYPSPGVDYTKITGTPAIPTTLPPSGPVPPGGALTGSYPSPGVDYTKVTNTPTIPTTLPPSGPVPGGDLAGSTYPSPVVAPLAITTAKLARGASMPVHAQQSASAQPVLTATPQVLVEETVTLEQTRPVLVLATVRNSNVKISGAKNPIHITLRVAVGGTQASDGTDVAVIDYDATMGNTGDARTMPATGAAIYVPAAAGATRFKVYASADNVTDYTSTVLSAVLTVAQLA